MGEPLRIPLQDTPERCENCGYGGHGDDQWPLGVYGGRLNVTCPQCHVIIAEVVAVPLDN
jgi:hypothetical protein